LNAFVNRPARAGDQSTTAKMEFCTMSVTTEKSTFLRACEIAGILTVPVFAFQLGRYSEAFSGSALAWSSALCYAVVLPFVLYLQIRKEI
jgi:hypothetical protein